LGASIAFAYPFASSRIAVSEGVAHDLATLSGLPLNRWDVIPPPNAAPDPSAVRELSEAEAVWGSQTAKRVLSVGSLKREKNFPLLLRAFAQLADQRDVRLVLLGEGPERPVLESIVEELKLSSLVSLPGFRANPWPFFASADVYAMSSDYEGFGMVLVEALNFGLPVVSTDCVSGPAEVLVGPYGKLVPCGDPDSLAAAIDEMLDRPGIAAAAMQRAADYSAEHIADRYLELLLGETKENG
jgi:glycosyltransferase involved in cell wall biosynthesis